MAGGEVSYAPLFHEILISLSIGDAPDRVSGGVPRPRGPLMLGHPGAEGSCGFLSLCDPVSDGGGSRSADASADTGEALVRALCG